MKAIKGLVFALGLITFSCSAPGNLKKADDLYDKVSYARAAEVYSKLLGSKVDNATMKSKLADCYYQTGETKKAVDIYAQMINQPDATSEDYYKYAQSLKENGNYAESDQWMKKFNTSASADSRGREFEQNQSYLDKILSQDAYFSIRHLEEVNTPQADFGGYPKNKESVLFVSNRKKRISVQHTHTYNNRNFLDVYSAKRESNGDLVNASFNHKKINKRFHEGSLAFAPDGKTVFFTRNNMSPGKNRRDDQGIQQLKIYLADVNAEGDWVNEREFPLNSKEYSVGHPSVSADGKVLYFSSNMPGGLGGSDIYKVQIKENGSFGTPENLGADINTEGQEMFPWITQEGLLFYSSDGRVGLGGLDVFVAIPKKDGSINKVMNVGKPINSQKDDFALVMLDDNLTGYVSSNRDGGKGDDDIYAFNLLRPLKVDLMVEGVIADRRTKSILPGAEVFLLDESGNEVATTTANEKGEFQFNVEPEKNYTIAAKKDKYFDNQGDVSTINLPQGTELINKDVDLEKDPGLSLYALVTDAKSNNPIDGVTVIVTDNMTGKSDTVETTQLGEYRRPLFDKKLDDRGSYNFTLVKEGYFPKTITYNTLFDREGQYNVHENLNFSLDPAVTDLAEMIEINPINFDLNKYNIRPDAAAELDKIVAVMNQYPELVVELGSHTDCRASKAYNMRLSDKRAKASAAYIKSKITNPERIYGKGYGESRLLNDCECEGRVKSDCSEEEHEENRRTEFKVISVGKEGVGVKNNSTNSFDK